METFRPVRQFDMNIEDNRMAAEWEKWKRQLECYFSASGVMDQSDKLAKLLYLGGPDLQELYENLPDAKRVPLVVAEPPHYVVAIKALDDHFEPKRMVAYERYLFRQMTQKPLERLSDFALRLRIQAKRCGFSSEHFEEMIVDQITEKCNSELLRVEILKKDRRSLSEIIALGTTMADTKAKSMQMSKMSGYTDETKIQMVRDRPIRFMPRFPAKKVAMNQGTVMTCYACGRLGHLKSSKWCPAKEAQCNKCQAYGHFSNTCFRFSRNHQDQSSGLGKRKADSRSDNIGNEFSGKPAKRIRAVTEEDAKEKLMDREDGYVFYAMGSNEFHFTVGGVTIQMTIDSGADANIISLGTWNQMKEAGVHVTDQGQPDQVLKAYASDIALKLIGTFKAKILAGSNEADAKFYVVDGDHQCLLGAKTAQELHVLKIGFDIASVKNSTNTFPKIKGVLLEIPIDESAQPVQQPYRRAPIALEGLIEKRLHVLLDQDIIEKVSKPSAWVSPLVPVLKDSGEVRLCVDMWRANRAVLREKHPLPVIDELLGGINGAIRFSKLDIKDAYHQIEISERSREITTFITKYGLFR